MSKKRSGMANHRKAYGYCNDNTTTYISIINTIWLYPENDLDLILMNTSISYNKTESSITFNTLTDLADFYSEVYNQTAISQPNGNVGYSLGVGTITKAYGNKKLYLKLNTGQTVVVWTLMTQITNQSDLPVGGNSPNQTVGWGLIYCDWNLDGIQDSLVVALPNENVDKLLFRIV
jgi:hypothetical protein